MDWLSCASQLVPAHIQKELAELDFVFAHVHSPTLPNSTIWRVVGTLYTGSVQMVSIESRRIEPQDALRTLWVAVWPSRRIWRHHEISHTPIVVNSCSGCIVHLDGPRQCLQQFHYPGHI